MNIKVEAHGGPATGKTKILQAIRQVLILAGFNPEAEVEIRYLPDGSEHWESLEMTRPDEHLERMRSMDVV